MVGSSFDPITTLGTTVEIEITLFRQVLIVTASNYGRCRRLHIIKHCASPARVAGTPTPIPTPSPILSFSSKPPESFCDAFELLGGLVVLVVEEVIIDTEPGVVEGEWLPKLANARLNDAGKRTCVLGVKMEVVESVQQLNPVTVYP